MALAPAVAILAAVYSAISYLDAKFHFTKDIRDLWNLKATEYELAAAGESPCEV